MVVDEDETSEDAALVDLLRGMISGTHWSYAEMWVSTQAARRHLVAAAYARPGRHGVRLLEGLSRALALRPDECLLRRAPADGSVSESCVLPVDLAPGSDLSSSPRAHAMREAQIASAMSFFIHGPSDRAGKKVALVVLMSQRGLAEDAEQRAAEALHIQKLSSLCKTAAPYLAHLDRSRNGGGGGRDKEREGETARQAAFLPPSHRDSTFPDKNQAEGDMTHNDTSYIADDKQTRSPITYKSPMRRKFNSVSEDIRPGRLLKTQSPSASKFGSNGGFSLSVEYNVVIAEALRKFPPHKDGKPHPFRVSALWNIFEQLCEVPGSLNSVLAYMREELKPAIFSDALMAADDGLSLIRMPHFEQIDYRTQQVAERDEKAAALQREIEQLHVTQQRLNQALQDNKRIIEQEKRKAFLAERRLIKMKLEVFFRRKTMVEDLRDEQVIWHEYVCIYVCTRVCTDVY
jgi:hypothetical protein